MSKPTDDRLLPIAESIADGEPVDWAGRAAESPELGTALERLRALQRLAETHRRAAGEGDATVGEHAGPAREPALFVWGSLRVLGTLGAGAFGEVYRAWDPALQREVALKLRPVAEGGDARSARRWLDEGRRLARVRHPNVLTVFGADVHDGRAGIWTERLHGRTLEAWLGEHGPLGAREAAGVGIDLCAALSAVHAAGLVHGDVKTTNVMREGSTGNAAGSGRIVLMDFGAAHERGADLSGEGGALGTPLASAPEVLEGAAPTPASDLYSLGVVLYRLACGRYPLEASSLAELRDRLRRGERTPLRAARPDLPQAFVQVVERALAGDPAQRFRNAGEMELALAAVTGAGVPAKAAPARARGTLALAAAALAIAAAAFVLTRRSGPPRLVDPSGPSAQAPATGQVRPPVAETRAARTPAALRVDATLYRSKDGASESLASGGQVAPGDRLYLEWESAENLYVYVLDEDRAGSVYVLFPMPGVDLANPLPPGATIRLPGKLDGAPLDWQVTSAGGRETILTVASRTPLAELERQVAAMEPARPGRPVSYAELPPGSIQRLRGIGGAIKGTPDLGSGTESQLARLARNLSRSARPESIWIRAIELENPGP